MEGKKSPRSARKYEIYDEEIVELLSDQPKDRPNFNAVAQAIVSRHDIDPIKLRGIWQQVKRVYNEKLGETVREAIASASATGENDYPDKPEEGTPEGNHLRDYCLRIGIPYDKVRSAKFVNHQGQEAWNIVLDPDSTGFSIDEKLDRFKKAIEAVVEPSEWTEPEERGNVALHVYTSDKHVGAQTKANSIYENEYNPSVFAERMSETIDLILNKAHQFGGSFDKLLVTDLGDAQDGYNGKTTRGGHQLPQNLTDQEAYDTYVREHIRFFNTIAQMNEEGIVGNVEFIACANSNHGGAWDYASMRAVEIYLNVAHPWIKTTVSDRFFVPYQYGIHTFLFTHGKDDEDMKSGMPMNLDKKTENWINQYLLVHGLNDRENISIIKGDLHRDNRNFGDNVPIRYRNVLSMYGSSKWIHHNFGFNRAGVSYDIVEEDNEDIMEGCLKF